jgi:hypothetical protein
MRFCRSVITYTIVVTAVSGGSIPPFRSVETLVTITPRVIEAVLPDDTEEELPFYRHAGENARLTMVVSAHPAGLSGFGMSGEVHS